MELGMIELGRMGSNMVRRLLNAGHRIIAYDPIPSAVDEVVKQGAVGAASLAELAEKLSKPRSVWMMVPSGEPAEKTITELKKVLDRGDIILDGGNSYYKDSMKRAEDLSKAVFPFWM